MRALSTCWLWLVGFGNLTLEFVFRVVRIVFGEVWLFVDLRWLAVILGFEFGVLILFGCLLCRLDDFPVRVL